jgi:DNA-binding transcriptional ArsR family regulator
MWHIKPVPTSFELLADPTRRQLLDELRRGEQSVGTLVERLGLNQPAVSKQLRVLREAGLATVRVDAQRRFYRLEAAGLREVDEWLAPFRVCWEERLDALEQTLDGMED